MALNDLLVEDQQHDTLLFAGSADVSITDWFFFKDHITLKYIGLNDATINMKRNDSTWNYQFLVDYFSSPQTNTTKKGGIELDVKQVELKNIQFNKTDGWVGKNVKISVKQLSLDADEINFSKKKIDINTLKLDRPLYTELFYPGKRDSLNYVRPKSTAPASSPDDYWSINVKSIHINDGTFGSATRSETPSPENVFDGGNIFFSSINGDIKNARLEKDTLFTDFSLSTKERSGFEVKKIEASLKFTPDMMEFNKLNIVTNKSKLSNYYAMHFANFDEDMANFLHNIKIDARFDNSEVSSDDIAFFAPDLKTWKRNFKLKGIFKGTVNDFTAKQMNIRSGNSMLEGDIELNGLPDINNTYIDLKSNNLQTNYSDITTIIPSLRKIQQPDLAKLSSIQFKGNFTGFIKDFVAFGTINTNLGTITSDVNLKFPDNKPAVYNGTVSANNFQLGNFIDMPGIGNITFNGKINGSGFSADDVNTNFDGSISQIGCCDYVYQNIVVNGNFSKRLFNGTLHIDDPNLKLDNLTGKIDLSGKVPQFDFDATLSKANLKQLTLTHDDFVMSGHFNLNFSGSNIDNFIGTAIVNNASVLHNGTPLSFDSLSLRSEIVDNEKVITLQSNDVEASVNGNFKILELPDAFKVFLSRYYPAYITKPNYAVGNQDLHFQIKTNNFNAYTQLLDPKLQGFDNATLSGSLKTQTNSININATVPEFGYDGKVFNNIKLESNGNLDTLFTKITADDIALNDSLHLPSTNLVVRSHNNISDVNINTSASKTLNKATLNAQIETVDDKARITFAPSSFIINDKEWDLEKDGELILSKSQIIANNVKLTQGNQQINLSTESSDTYESNDVVLNLQKVNINDLSSFVVTSPKLEGLMTGNVRIADPFRKPIVDYDIKAEQFRLDDDSIGTLTAKGNYSGVSGIASFSVKGDNPSAKLNIEGTINTKDSVNQANIAFVAEKFNLAILNNYLGSVFSDIKGDANTSDLHISGSGKHLLITGTAFVNTASLRVNYTQCRYSFSDAPIIFNPDEIDLGTIRLKDSLNNKATLSGKMYHNFFQNFEFDNLHFSTNKCLVLNTTKKDNNLFYGKVIGRADMTLNGPITNMMMNIDGAPSSIDSSQIYLLSSSSIESGTIDYINFKQFGSKMQEGFTGSKSANILVDMNLSANPACKINVILDEVTGDIISGSGYCDQLNIRVGTNEPLSIRGRYDITQGDYTFNFQRFLKKPFTLTSGSIVWSNNAKDPTDATINIVAEYLAKDVDFSSIPSLTSSTSLSGNRAKSDVKVVAILTESLSKPKIDFKFVLPEYSQFYSDFVANKYMQEFQNDESERNKQVTSLLLFNSFISNSQTLVNAEGTYSVFSNTIGGVLSSTLSALFNNVLGKYGKIATVYINTTSSLNDLEKNVAKLQAAVATGAVFTLNNGKIIISAGVNLDFNDPYLLTATNSNLFVTPDITAEFLLNKDGSVRIVGFNKTNVDINGQRNRTGAKLTYQKDFDHSPFEFLLKLFRSSAADDKTKDKIIPPPKDTTGGG